MAAPFDVSRLSTFTIEPGPLARHHSTVRMRRLDQLGFAEALWSKRLDVWTADPAIHAADRQPSRVA